MSAKINLFYSESNLAVVKSRLMDAVRQVQLASTDLCACIFPTVMSSGKLPVGPYLGLTSHPRGMTSMDSYLKFLQAKIPETGDEDYSECFDEEIPFTIEISIPMRKPEGHFSRKSRCCVGNSEFKQRRDVLQRSRLLERVQEPVIYLMISTIGTPRDVLSRIKGNLETIQMKLKQQEVFLKLNGESFVGSVIFDEIVNKFPKQWKFDDDLRAITANQTRRDEHYKIIFGGLLKITRNTTKH